MLFLFFFLFFFFSFFFSFFLFFLACHLQWILISFISWWSFNYSSTSFSSYNCFITGYFIGEWLLRCWWGSATNCWDIGWDSGTDCWDFDRCSAKLFRYCSWIISSLFWEGTASFWFAKDESVSSKSNLKVSFDFSICRWFLWITVFLSVYKYFIWSFGNAWFYDYTFMWPGFILICSNWLSLI